MIAQEKAHEILLILVSYKIELIASESLISLQKSAEASNCSIDLFVYDNSPESQDPGLFQMKNVSLLKYIHDPKNPGVSKAYNEGVSFAKSINKRWIMLLDQDTVFPKSSFSEIFGSIDKYTDINLFAPILKNEHSYISPTFYKFNRGFAPKTLESGFCDLNRFSPVNSGLFLSVDLFMAVGGYNERIVLDFSDFYFIDKIKRKISTFVILNMICKHSLSSNDNSDISSLIYRYKTFCDGAKFSADGFKEHLIYFSLSLMRGVKLTYKYKKGIFLKTLYKCYM